MNNALIGLAWGVGSLLAFVAFIAISDVLIHTTIIVRVVS